MSTLFIGFKGKNNASAMPVHQLGGDFLLLTNSFEGLEKDILSIAKEYDTVCMFGVDKRLNNAVRIEQCAMLHGAWVSSDFDIQALSQQMVQHKIHHSISDVPTQYLCNAAYYHMLCKNKNTVFIHIPSINGMNGVLMDRLLILFQPSLSQNS